jgi:hypothetical protein
MHYTWIVVLVLVVQQHHTRGTIVMHYTWIVVLVLVVQQHHTRGTIVMHCTWIVVLVFTPAVFMPFCHSVEASRLRLNSGTSMKRLDMKSTS